MDLFVSAFSLGDQFEKYGAYFGVASFFGLAVLSLLYFAQAREVKRLRDWAGRAPERQQEIEQRVAASAQARTTQPVAQPLPVPVQPPRPVAPQAPGAQGANGTGPAVAVPPPGETQEHDALAEDPVAATPAGAAAPAAGEADAVAPDDEVDDEIEAQEEGTAAGVSAADAPAAAGAAAPTNLSGAPAAGAPAPGTAAPATGPGAPAAPGAPAGGAPAAGGPPGPPPPPPGAVRGAKPLTAAGATGPNDLPPLRPAAPASPPAPLRMNTATAAVRRQGSAPQGNRRPSATRDGGEGSAARLTLMIGGGVLAALIVIILAVVLIGGGDGGGTTETEPRAGATPTAEATPRRSATPRADASPVPPRNETVVTVLNGTTFSGLAATLSGQAENAGFKKGKTATNTDQTIATSVVYYEKGYKRRADEVAKTLSIESVQPMNQDIQSIADQGAAHANVVVVAGADKTQ